MQSLDFGFGRPNDRVETELLKSPIRNRQLDAFAPQVGRVRAWRVDQVGRIGRARNVA